MNAPEESGLSPVQKRYTVLTHECGLKHEEALHALGRRTGGFPEYRKLSRLEQLNKFQELVSSGLTQEEAGRVVGVPVAQPEPSTPPIDGSDSALIEQTSRRSKPGSPRERCFNCKQASSDLAYVPERVWLCAKCRKPLRKARKADKHRRELTSYSQALTHPEFKGLTGVRK